MIITIHTPQIKYWQVGTRFKLRSLQYYNQGYR